MEFNTHLARVQGCLTLSKRVLGPLDQLTLDDDFDAVQVVLKTVKDGIAGFSEKELYQTHLFLLLNSSCAANDENLLESDLCHLLGIAPIISLDVLVALSVEVFSQHDFIYDAMSFLPPSLSYEITSSLISLYVTKDLEKIAQKLDMLCLSVYYNALTSKCEKDFLMFLSMLKTVLICILNHESKANFFTYTYLLKSVLLLLKSCLREEIPFDAQKWQDFYTRPSILDDYARNNVDSIKNLVIEHARKICLNIPAKANSQSCEKFLSLFKPVKELAFDCLAEFGDVSPTCDSLLDVLRCIAEKPRDILDEIEKSSLSDLCAYSLIENDNQHLWLHALICHDDGLKDKEALKTLHTLVDLFNTDDYIFVCDTFHSFPSLKTDSLRDLAVKCYGRLSVKDKLEMLEDRVRQYESEDIVSSEHCESDILEMLNRLVAQEGTNYQEDQLIVLAYKSPRLVAKHVLLTATLNRLFSTSVLTNILQSLRAAFACPYPTPIKGTNLTDVILSDSIFGTDEINKKTEGLPNLVRVLLKENLINPEYFLRFCIFPPLFIGVKERQERTVILLLEILLDLQSGVPHWEKGINIATLLVFLGQLLEWFSRSALEESQGSIVREIAVRNIDKIFTSPGCLESVQDADKEWMLDELSVLSPANRHHFAAVAPEWTLCFGDQGDQVCVTLATVLPYLHVTEWHQLVKILPPVCEENSPKSSSKVFIFCSAVNLIVRAGTHRTPAKIHLNLKSCIRNLGSVIQSHLKSGLEPRHLPRVLRELLVILECFPKSEQFDVAVFLLPVMFEIVEQGGGDGKALTAFGKMMLETSIECVRRDLGRLLRRLSTNFVNGNTGASNTK